MAIAADSRLITGTRACINDFHCRHRAVLQCTLRDGEHTGNRTYRLLCVYGKLTFYTDVIRRASTNENRTVKVISTEGPIRKKVCCRCETV